jgi:16S rRNA (uracil1498-N3)-methyltransferase
MSLPPRFIIERNRIRDCLARVAGAELHHLRDVMRLKAGDEVTLLDEGGVEYSGRVERLEPSSALIAISAARRRNPRGVLILASALIKGPRMDFLVEKAAELGASELWPLLSQRSVARGLGGERIARWRRLAVAAAKQSLAPHTMEIRTPLGIAGLMANVPRAALAVLCAPDGQPLGGLIRHKRPRAIILACGPEGGFDDDETATMRAGGFIAAALGPNRLRSETAALAALSIAAAALDERYRGS